MSDIKFGTDGWRAQMGKEFSFKNVRMFARGYAGYLKRKQEQKEKDLEVVVNYDTRLLSRKYAHETAKILSIERIKTFIPERDVPLAPVSLAIIKNRLAGGITFTASFNKPIYNGIKVFSDSGKPALPEETHKIEEEIEKVEKVEFKPQYPDHELIDTIDLQSPYIAYIEELIDFELIKESGIKVIVDNLYGTSRDFLDYVLSKNGIDVETIHNFPHSPLEGIISSCSKGNLADLSCLVVERGAHIGLATDIDGDRFGIVDARGRYMTSNLIMPPLIEYLVRVRTMQGGIVKSISATNNIRRVAKYYSRDVYTTPVGFKYLADIMSSKKAFIAVESTNGASLNSTINIKDGILFSLLVTEMLAYYQLDMDGILADFYSRFPKLYDLEIALKKSKERALRYGKLRSQGDFAFDGWHLKDVKTIDGVKFVFDDGWLLIRESGTDDVIRIYAEAAALKRARALIKLGRGLIG